MRTLLCLLVLGLWPAVAGAAPGVGDSRVSRAENQAQARNHLTIEGEPKAAGNLASVGRIASAVNSRGALVAQTWQDWQGQGHSVAINPAITPAGPAAIHFTYTARTAASLGHDRWGYASFDGLTGVFPLGGGKVIVQSDSSNSTEVGEYSQIAVDPAGGKAIVAGYDYPDSGGTDDVRLHVAFDLNSMTGQFGNISSGSIMPETINRTGNIYDPDAPALWPKFLLTYTATDTVLYVAAVERAPEGEERALKLYRKFGGHAPGLDTTWQLVSTQVCSGRSDAVIWSPLRGVIQVWISKGDVWISESPDGKPGTWTEAKNVTKYSEEDPGIRAVRVLDAYVTWFGFGKLVIEVEETVTVKGKKKYRRATLTEQSDGSFKRTDYGKWQDAQIKDNKKKLEPSPMAGLEPGSPNANQATLGGEDDDGLSSPIGGASIGECDGRLYIVYSIQNDPDLGPGDDVPSGTGSNRAGNGELYMVVSKDLTGSSWDEPRNISNSYTPDCDSGTCASDEFPSLAPVGMDDADYLGTEDWDGAYTYDPSSTYTGSKWLHLFYVTDRYPGFAGLGQGPWTLNDLRWIRLACVSPVIAANLGIDPEAIDFPEFTHPGVSKNYTITLRNSGNTDLNLTSILNIEDSTRGVSGISGWLAHAGAPSSIPEGTSTTMTLTLNAGGVITADPTVLFGKLRFAISPPSRTVDLPIRFTVADTVASTTWDTLHTSCTRLAVGTNGNIGHTYGDSERVSVGKVNLDYFSNVNECDSGGNSRGNSRIYLGDGSPIIIRKTGLTRLGSWSAFSADYDSPNGFKPMTGAGFTPHGAFSTANYDGFNSGTFETADSLVKVEETWWAPKAADSCNFIIQRMRVFPANISSAVTGLQIGEMVDFDVPSDTSDYNSQTGNLSGGDSGRRLIWQRGFNSGDAVSDCADNSTRYAGLALLFWHMKDWNCFDSLYSGLTIPNSTYIYGGLQLDTLAAVMHVPGFSLYPEVGDVSSILTFKDGVNGYTLPANETLTVYTALATVRAAATTAAGLDSLQKSIDKAKNFLKKSLGFCNLCCVGKRGNVNVIGIVDLSDLSSLVSYLTGGGYVLPCYEAANVNGTGIVDLSDLSCLVNYLTGGGYVIPDCP